MLVDVNPVGLGLDVGDKGEPDLVVDATEVHPDVVKVPSEDPGGGDEAS